MTVKDTAAARSSRQGSWGTDLIVARTKEELTEEAGWIFLKVFAAFLPLLLLIGWAAAL